MTAIKQYDPTLASKIAVAAEQTLNEMMLRMPPNGCQDWYGIIAKWSDDEDIHEMAMEQVARGEFNIHTFDPNSVATKWLNDKKAEYLQSYNGVYWIKDATVAVEFKLLFS